MQAALQSDQADSGQVSFPLQPDAISHAGPTEAIAERSDAALQHVFATPAKAEGKATRAAPTKSAAKAPKAPRPRPAAAAPAPAAAAPPLAADSEASASESEFADEEESEDEREVEEGTDSAPAGNQLAGCSATTAVSAAARARRTKQHKVKHRAPKRADAAQAPTGDVAQGSSDQLPPEATASDEEASDASEAESGSDESDDEWPEAPIVSDLSPALAPLAAAAKPTTAALAPASAPREPDKAAHGRATKARKGKHGAAPGVPAEAADTPTTETVLSVNEDVFDGVKVITKVVERIVEVYRDPPVPVVPEDTVDLAALVPDRDAATAAEQQLAACVERLQAQLAARDVQVAILQQVRLMEACKY